MLSWSHPHPLYYVSLSTVSIEVESWGTVSRSLDFTPQGKGLESRLRSVSRIETYHVIRFQSLSSTSMLCLYGDEHHVIQRHYRWSCGNLASFPGRVDSKNNTADRQLVFFNFVLLKKNRPGNEAIVRGNHAMLGPGKLCSFSPYYAFLSTAPNSAYYGWYKRYKVI